MRRAQRVGLDPNVRPLDGRDVAGRPLDRAGGKAGVGRILVGDPNVADQRHRGDRGPFEARGAVHQRVEAAGHHRPGRHRRDQRRRDQPRHGEGARRRSRRRRGRPARPAPAPRPPARGTPAPASARRRRARRPPAAPASSTADSRIAGHRRQQRAGAAGGRAIVAQRARGDEDAARQHHQGRARPRSRRSPWARSQRDRRPPPRDRARTARRPAPPRRSPPPGGRRAAGAAAARPRGSSEFRPARSSPAPNRINFGAARPARVAVLTGTPPQPQSQYAQIILLSFCWRSCWWSSGLAGVGPGGAPRSRVRVRR